MMHCITLNDVGVLHLICMHYKVIGNIVSKITAIVVFHLLR